MKDTLDPEIGQKEIKAMQKEIHIMEMKFEKLWKQQEEMIKDMEWAVFKWETI